MRIIQILKEEVGELYRRYYRLIYKISYEILGKKEEAEDAVQETCMRLTRNHNKIDDIDSDRTRNYVYTIALNTAKKEWINNRKYQVQSFEDIEFNRLEAETAVESVSDKLVMDETIRGILVSLDETERNILALHYGGGYSLQEVADTLEMSKGAVYKRHQRMIKRIRNRRLGSEVK